MQSPEKNPLQEELDPTRPWISAEGDEDGNGRLPVYIVHYGGNPAIERSAKTGKPWGVGEAGGAYYAAPEQVAKSYAPLALQQGWNHVLTRLKRAGAAETFAARLLSSDPAFLTQLASALQRP